MPVDSNRKLTKGIATKVASGFTVFPLATSRKGGSAYKLVVAIMGLNCFQKAPQCLRAGETGIIAIKAVVLPPRA